MKYSFCKAAELTKQLSVSRSYLRDRRNAGDWREGIHWNYLNPHNHRAGIRYNTQLCMNWIACKGTTAHEEAIQAYLATLQSDSETLVTVGA